MFPLRSPSSPLALTVACSAALALFAATPARAGGFLDCAFAGGGKAYFFRGAEYVRWDIAADRADPDYPKPIEGNWKGVWPRDLDAAFATPTGKVYFFKGAEYVRYDLAADRADPDYPKSIESGWKGVWRSDLDAVMAGGNGKIYFFKGSEYVRFDLAADRADIGYPFLLSIHWRGLWPGDLDDALAIGDRAYFFKDGEYIRYDLTADRAEPGYPKSIADNWRGLWTPPPALAAMDAPPRPACADGLVPAPDGSCRRPLNLPAPPADKKAARDMTWEEACEVLLHLVWRGELVLADWSDKTGRKRVAPYTVKQCSDALYPAAGSRVVRLSLPIEGVRIVRAAAENTALREEPAAALDVRAAVLLFRLAKHLRENWGASRLELSDFGTDKPAAASSADWHASGRALDVAAVGGILPRAMGLGMSPGAYRVSVTEDWSRMPERRAQGRRAYRLGESTERQAQIAFRLFRDLYRFAARESADTAQAPGGNNIPLDAAGKPLAREPGDLPARNPQRLQLASGFIAHPDHWSDPVARAHAHCLHMQVGPSLAEHPIGGRTARPDPAIPLY